MENGKKWYQKTFVVILLLVLFAPAGIFILWIYKVRRTAKKFLTAVFVLVPDF
jgi:hypothetical protein